MKNVKKLNFMLAFVLVLACFVPMLTGCFGATEPDQFMIKYTEDLQFLVGEEYNDPNLQGTLIKADETEVDVTETMTVDTSNYNKDEIGKYKIYCECSGIKLFYEVEVVNTITNIGLINERASKVFENTFKRDEEGVFSYTVSNTQVLGEDPTTVEFAENLTYIDDNGDISLYLSWAFDGMDVCEYWYVGTEEIGTLTLRTAQGETVDVIETVATMEELYVVIMQVAIESELPISVYPMNLSEMEFEGMANAELRQEADGSYVIDEIYEDEGETYTVTLKYKNDVYTELDGVSYKFPDAEDAAIPTIPEPTEPELPEDPIV